MTLINQQLMELENFYQNTLQEVLIILHFGREIEKIAKSLTEEKRVY